MSTLLSDSWDDVLLKFLQYDYELEKVVFDKINNKTHLTIKKTKRYCILPIDKRKEER